MKTKSLLGLLILLAKNLTFRAENISQERSLQLFLARLLNLGCLWVQTVVRL